MKFISKLFIVRFLDSFLGSLSDLLSDFLDDFLGSMLDLLSESPSAH